VDVSSEKWHDAPLISQFAGIKQVKNARAHNGKRLSFFQKNREE
jgi:hypothetical protein